ncbi:MAG TPA: hypothetical protein VEH31_42425 [Streptosporangiaceae bacterium]|nr:hypothetical protein [Streptosporangiaceae bacterium]
MTKGPATGAGDARDQGPARADVRPTLDATMLIAAALAAPAVI